MFGRLAAFAWLIKQTRKTKKTFFTCMWGTISIRSLVSIVGLELLWWV